MIVSFNNKDTEAIFDGLTSRKIPSEILRRSERKLKMISAATEVNDLKLPPGNHLEELAGKRKGQHSIRINDKWRICFEFKGGNAYNVEIIDYH